jgi:hypothetical protein
LKPGKFRIFYCQYCQEGEKREGVREGDICIGEEGIKDVRELVDDSETERSVTSRSDCPVS